MTKISDLYERLESNPNDAQAHWQLGCALAFTGKWEEAWAEMEWRFKGHVPSMKKREKYKAPDWDGKRCEKLLIYQDQGFGDLFQWVRFVKYLPVTYAYLEVSSEVYNLLYWDDYNVVLRGNPLPEYDRVIAVSSLPRWFKEFYPEPYIVPPSPNKFKMSGSGKKIGIAWAGNSEYYNDGNRSCDPEEFLPLAEAGELVSLMLKTTKLPFTDLSLKLVDFASTAEVIGQLDCVVSVDTAVAHLAAAIGVPTYLALPYEHDWRWGVSGETTPWYKSMRLFRQPEPGDWKSVFNKIKAII